MADKRSSGDNEKQLYLTQIREIEDQLDRYRFDCDELEKHNSDLASQCKALEREEKDVSRRLKHTEAKNEREVDRLLMQLQTQQRAAEQDREALSLQHDQQKQKIEEQINTLTSQSIAHAANILEQKEQLEKLIQQLEHVDSLQEKLASQKECIHRLKREAAMHTVKIIGAMNDLLKIRVRDTLQKERDQRSKLGERLLFLLNESMRLQNVRNTLEDRNMELCIQRDSLKKDLKMVKQESITYKKQVQRLSSNCSELNVELKNCSVAHQQIVANVEGLRKQRNQLLEMCKNTDEADQLAAELQKERSRQRQLQSVNEDAAVILRHILSESDKSSESQWKVQRLLEILESIAC